MGGARDKLSYLLVTPEIQGIWQAAAHRFQSAIQGSVSMLQRSRVLLGLKLRLGHSQTARCSNITTFVLILAAGVQTMPRDNCSEIVQDKANQEQRETHNENV